MSIWPKTDPAIRYSYNVMQTRRASISKGLLLILGLLVLAAAAKSEMSAEAKKYLDAALETIKSKAVKRNIDWAKMRSAAYLAAADAQKPADTYRAIEGALRLLDDHHSDFITPLQQKGYSQGTDYSPGLRVMDCYVVRVVPNGPAAKAGLRVGMRVLEVNGKAVSSTSDYDTASDQALNAGNGRMSLLVKDAKGQQSNLMVLPGVSDLDVAPSGRWLAGGYGYIDVPAFLGGDALQRAYANKIQDAIRAADRDGTKGWIVDLRLNAGGDMYPMLAGLGPLLGNGQFGSFVTASSSASWGYRDGSAVEDGEPQTTITPYKVRHRNLPIVVLIDEPTASSGEIVALSFVGARNTVLMGEDSSGLTTSNTEETLPDGAIVNLCEAVDADRTGKRYGGVIHPNIGVKTIWSKFGTDGDTAIKAAISWINKRH